MPTSFLSDDQLYEERGHIAEEGINQQRETAHVAIDAIEPTKVSGSFKKLNIAALSAAVGIGAVLIALWHQLSRLVSSALFIFMLYLCSLPLAAPTGVEMALIGGEHGMLATHGLLGIIRAVVDSGATSSAVGEDLGALITEVTEANPNRKLWIADNKGLDIITIGKSSLAVKGFKNGQPNVLFTDRLPISRLLVVRGMAKGQILLSVRGAC